MDNDTPQTAQLEPNPIRKHICLTLYAKDQHILRYMDLEGYKLTETLRMLLREWGDRTFPKPPAYAQAQLERVQLKKQQINKKVDEGNMTTEDWAVKKLRGKIKGDMVEFRLPNGSAKLFDLNTIKERTIENTQEIALHNQLLDKTFTYPNGQKPTPEQYAIIFKDY